MRSGEATETGQPHWVLGQDSFQGIWGNLNVDCGLNNSNLSGLTTKGVSHTHTPFPGALGHTQIAYLGWVNYDISG